MLDDLNNIPEEAKLRMTAMVTNNRSVTGPDMGFQLFLLLLALLYPSTFTQEIVRGNLVLNRSNSNSETNENFICATIDWWPHDKCDYNQCPRGYSSIINLMISHPLLGKAIQGPSNGDICCVAFCPFVIRTRER